MKTAILAGGLGTRLREETEFRPKPLVEIGGIPIIRHIMEIYMRNGFNDFSILAGYKSHLIKEYFLEYQSRKLDVRVSAKDNYEVTYLGNSKPENWTAEILFTGDLTPTGGRLYLARNHFSAGTFFCTYGDGLADIDLQSLLHFHKSHGKIATVTVVNPLSRFGVMRKREDGTVVEFLEKPRLDGIASAGFFVFEPEIFEYLDINSTLELEPLAKLAKEGNLMAYHHNGFWEPMDTYRETKELNQMWDTGKAPWL